jgi:hypothetical protein
MNTPRASIFRGAGIDGASWFALRGTSRIPYKRQGATWPFARLSISEEAVKFDIALLSIHKTATPSSVLVSLNKLGVVYFKSPDDSNDFGFCTVRLEAVLRELRRYGFSLEDSCKRNLLTAKLALSLQVILIVVLAVAFVVQ